MRRHQAVGTAHPVASLDDLRQQRQEVDPVAVLPKELAPGDRSGRDVIRGTGNLEARRTGHGPTIGASLRAEGETVRSDTEACAFCYGV